MEAENIIATPSTPKSSSVPEKSKLAPAQEKSAQSISQMESELIGFLTVENSGLITPEISKRKRKLQDQLEQEKKRLKSLKDGQARSQKFRDTNRAKIIEVCEKIPEAGALLKVRKEPGRPRLEEDQPDLLQVISSIASLSSGAHLRRRDETLRCCRTLDELHKQLKDFGFTISRSGTYLRLLPHHANSHEGKRHVKTVPVKLVKAQTSEHKSHEDTSFCNATVSAINCLASFSGTL